MKTETPMQALKRRQRMKARYANDPAYREAAKQRARRNRETNRDHILAVKAAYRERKRRELADAELLRHYANRDAMLSRQAAYRQAKHDDLRARARAESLHLTDSYVRNQLSKYSPKRTWQWTPEEVAEKRRRIIMSRAKRAANSITP